MTDLFAGTRGPTNARIAIVGEAYGAEEEKRQQPFVGGSGKEQDRILRECGIDPEQCFYTNVVNEKPFANDMKRFFVPTKEARAEGLTTLRGLYPRGNVLEGLDNLYAQLNSVDPELIICYGNYSLWALTDDCFRIGDSKDPAGWKVPTGIGQWGGSQLYSNAATGNRKLLPTYHPAAALRNWPWRYYIKHDLSARVKRLHAWTSPEYNFLVRPSFEDTVMFLTHIEERLTRGPVWLAQDLETRNTHIACYGIATDALNAISIPFMCLEDASGYWSEEEEIVIRQMLHRINEHRNTYIIGQNFWYDMQYIVLYHQHFPRLRWDTRIAQHLLYPGGEQNLNYLSRIWCDHHTYWKDEGKEWHPSMGEEQLWAYNCRDAVKTFEVKEGQEQAIAYYGLEEQMQFQMRQCLMLIRMMLRGVLIDQPRRAQLTEQLYDSAQSRAQWLEALIPEDIHPRNPKASPWYRSPPQSMQLFYDTLGLKPERKRTNNGYRPTINDAALEKLPGKEMLLAPVAQLLQEYRSIEAFSKFVHSGLDPDGRMRCEYAPTAETFRLQSSENAFRRGGNLQNIPRGTED